MLKKCVKVAKVGDLKENQMLGVKADGVPVLLALVQGNYFAVSGECTHVAMPLEQGTLCGFEVECPLHSSRFDLRTGIPSSEPAEEPLEVYQATVVEDEIFVGPKEG